jgi:carbon monoxide dehydrogenase subunit G
LKIGGSHTLAVGQQQAYEMLQDPEVLAQCMPGCDHLTKIGPDEYEMKMKMVISSIQGLFGGKVRIADPKPFESFRLIVEGNGKVGFMKGDGVLTLAPIENSSTEIRYEGDLHVGGMIAGVGQRLLDTTAKFMIKKFFEKLAAAAIVPPSGPRAA